MKKKITLMAVGFLVIALLVSGCTAVGLATSWPGLEHTAQLSYLAFGNFVYAIKNTDGTLAWKYPQDAKRDTTFFAAPAYDNNLVVFGDYTKNLYAVDAATGQEKWTFTEAGDKYVASPLIKDGIIYAANSDGHLYTLDTNGKLLWRFKTGKANWSSPVTDGTNLYLGSMDHFVYALKLIYSQDEIGADELGKRIAIQKPLWSTDLKTAIFGSPVLDGQGKLYATTLGGGLFALETGNGNLLWTYSASGKLKDVWSSPIVVDDIIMVGDSKGSIYAVDAGSGAEKWPKPVEAGTAVIGGGVSLAGKAALVTTGGKFLILNSDGSESWSKTFSQPIYTSPVVDGEDVYLASIGQNYLLTKIDLNGREFWSFNPPK
jgi:eukaryotic-like serine/threonine-protein kinase